MGSWYSRLVGRKRGSCFRAGGLGSEAAWAGRVAQESHLPIAPILNLRLKHVVVLPERERSELKRVGLADVEQLHQTGNDLIAGIRGPSHTLEHLTDLYLRRWREPASSGESKPERP